MIRGLRSATLAKKSFSTLSPKYVIGQNALRLGEIANAKTEADLDKVFASPLPSYDLKQLPEDLKGLEPYFGLDSVTSSKPYTPDPDAWFNKKFGDYVREEAGRAETWPFVVSFGVVNVLVFLFVCSLPEDMKKDSKYVQFCEERAVNKVFWRWLTGAEDKKHDHGHGHNDHGHGHH